jgi:hypothetical protein
LPQWSKKQSSCKSTDEKRGQKRIQSRRWHLELSREATAINSKSFNID